MKNISLLSLLLLAMLVLSYPLNNALAGSRNHDKDQEHSEHYGDDSEAVDDRDTRYSRSEGKRLNSKKEARNKRLKRREKRRKRRDSHSK